MMNYRFMTLLFMLLFLMSQFALGQDVMLGFKIGGNTYFGDIKNQKLGQYSGITTELWFSDQLALGILGYAAHITSQNSNYFFETPVYSLSASMKYRPSAKNVVSPYFQLGAEGFRFDPKDRNGNLLPNNEAGNYQKFAFSIPAGLGCSIFLGENFSFDIEGTYHFVVSDYLDDIKSEKNLDSFVSGSLGFSFHFGGAKDTDGDGIPDKRDLDPLHPEDFDGFQDEDGAPDLDNDQDGVPDIRDKAPMDPEDRDGFEDEDGVPDPDNDKDGILDVNDGAPDDPEDVDSYVDDDGVPDPDNDGDGIPDVQDECPGTDQTLIDGIDTKETYNGYEDKDGCPDVKPEIAVEKGESIVLEGVYFATGSANLTPNSKSILDKVVRTLQNNPKIEVEIRGHTDITGSYQTNMRLSQERADAVKIYLMNNGIDAMRIRTKGYGPDNPIAPNSTREGRAKNRRIEFYRIK
jgi:outer membrane protein OmpA-like peptidoglycan-associated protein